MTKTAELKKGKLNGTDKIALEKNSGICMEYSYCKTSGEGGELDLVKWKEWTENPYGKRKELGKQKE